VYPEDIYFDASEDIPVPTAPAAAATVEPTAANETDSEVKLAPMASSVIETTPSVDISVPTITPTASTDTSAAASVTTPATATDAATDTETVTIAATVTSTAAAPSTAAATAATTVIINVAAEAAAHVVYPVEQTETVTTPIDAITATENTITAVMDEAATTASPIILATTVYTVETVADTVTDAETAAATTSTTANDMTTAETAAPINTTTNICSEPTKIVAATATAAPAVTSVPVTTITEAAAPPTPVVSLLSHLWGSPSINQDLVHTKEAQSSIFECIGELEAEISNGLKDGQVVEKATHILESVAKVRKEVHAFQQNFSMSRHDITFFGGPQAEPGGLGKIVYNLAKCLR
jgi:hypothetical protein